MSTENQVPQNPNTAEAIAPTQESSNPPAGGTPNLAAEAKRDGLSPDEIKRIRVLTKRNYEYQAKLEQQQREIDELKKAQPKKEPEFKSDEEKARYLVRQEAEAVVNERDQKEAQSKAEQARQERIMKRRDESVTVAKEIYPDFDAVIQQAADVDVPQGVLAFVGNSEVGGLMAYEITKNKHLADKINSFDLSDEIGREDAYRFLLRLESKMTDKVESHRESKANSPSIPVATEEDQEAPPKPMVPVKPNVIAPKKSPSKMTASEYINWKNQQEREKRKKK